MSNGNVRTHMGKQKLETKQIRGRIRFFFFCSSDEMHSSLQPDPFHKTILSNFPQRRIKRRIRRRCRHRIRIARIVPSRRDLKRIFVRLHLPRHRIHSCFVLRRAPYYHVNNVRRNRTIGDESAVDAVEAHGRSRRHRKARHCVDIIRRHGAEMSNGPVVQHNLQRRSRRRRRRRCNLRADSFRGRGGESCCLLKRRNLLLVRFQAFADFPIEF